MNTPPPSPPGELVEDSEPEREQQRIAFKAQKREERKQKKLLLQQQQQQQQQEAGGTSRSSGTGEGFSAAGSSRVGGAAAASGGGDEEGSIQNGRNEGGRGGSSPFSSLSPTTTITTRPIDFSSYAYPKAKLKPSTSSNSFTSTTSTSAALPTTSSYFPARPSTSLPPPRRSKSKSIDPSDAPPECAFTDVEMRRLKKCVLCGEDWSQPGKKSRTKWAHLVNCTPAPSHSTLLDLIREYLDVVKAGGKEPRSLLEKKMFESVKEEEDQAGQLWDAVPDEDVVLVVDESTLGKGKGKGKARGSRSVSTTSKASSSSSSRRVVASVPPREEPSNSKSPSPFRSPSPTETADPSMSPPDPSIPANNHFSNFAYAGRSLSASTSNGGIKPRSTSAAAVVKPVVPACTIRDVEMRKVKKCIFCEEDWSTGKKMIKSKWAHLYSCSLLQTPPVSLSLLTHQITTHLQAPEPKTLLESLTMKKPKAKRGKGASAIPSMVLPAGHELSRETVMRNVESLMGDAEDEDETRRDGDDEEMEERRPPPSTQSFGTSGLAARFGSRKGSASGQEKRSLWAVGEEDGEAAVAGPSRLGGHSSEEDDDDESGSDSSMADETEEEQEEQPSKDAERPRTSLWGLAVDTTASQLVRAGDENILSSPPLHPPPQPKSKPSLLVPTQTIISLSSSSSSSSSAASSPLPTPLIQPPFSTTDLNRTSSNENSPSRPSPRSLFSARADPGRSSMEQENEEGSRRFDSEELEKERGGDSLISQEREERMSEDGPEADEGGMVDEEVVGSGEEEDVEEEATTNSSRSQHQRDISIISIDDNDEDDLPIQHQHQHQQRTPARNKLEPNDRDDLFSPSSNPSRSNPSKNSISINDRSHHIAHLNPNPEQSTSSPSSFPERNFWSDSPPRNASPSSSSYFLPPAQSTSTPNRSSNIGSSSRQEIIDLSDDDDDNWGQEGVLRWDGGDGNDLPPRDASSDDDVELLEHVSSSRPRPPTPTNASDPPSNVEEEDEEDEPYDQSDDRWGEEGVLVWDDVAGDVDDDEEQAGRAVGGVAEEEIYEGLEEEEEEEVEEEPPSNKITPSKPKTKTVASNKPKKTKTKSPPVMPDYEMMSIPQLQKIMKSYGTKISSSRPQLLRVLKEYWWIEHPLPTSSASSNDDDDEQDRAPSPSPARPRPKALPPRSRIVDSDSDSEDDQPLRMTSKSKAKGKARLDSSEEEEFDSDAPLATPKKKSKSKKDDGEGVSVPIEELPELFRNMIVAKEDLWLRVLRYEPVDFMELVTLVNERKVKTKGWQMALKKWLDGQCITYWTEEQTGPRRRH